MTLWLKHPKTGNPDTMLTLGTWATVSAIIKFMLNGVVFYRAGIEVLNFGTISSPVIAALLTPTLGAYVLRKKQDLVHARP